MARFRAKKVYGKSKEVFCSFCGKIATHKSEQGLEVCHTHIKNKLDEIKCTCGSWLEQKVGKFGPYFNCIKCGNLNYTKAMEIKAITMKDIPKVEVKVEVKRDVNEKREKIQFKDRYREKESPREITISTNDVDYFD